LLAVLCCEKLGGGVEVEARLEHVQVVVVVFDVEHFGHVADSILLTAALITSVTVRTRGSWRAHRTEPYGQLSRIRLPPPVCDGKDMSPFVQHGLLPRHPYRRLIMPRQRPPGPWGSPESF